MQITKEKFLKNPNKANEDLPAGEPLEITFKGKVVMIIAGRPAIEHMWHDFDDCPPPVNKPYYVRTLEHVSGSVKRIEKAWKIDTGQIEDFLY